MLLQVIARVLLGVIRALPIEWVARLGRAGGGLFYLLDARHRRVAVRNLTMCFGGERSPREIRSLARENFRRIGENFACAAKTAGMKWEEVRGRVEFKGMDRFRPAEGVALPKNFIVAIGHFGNFELFARLPPFTPGFRNATTYRGLRQPGLDKILRDLREGSGLLCFERRTGSAALREALSQGQMVLGLLADQHAGDHGVRAPFFGRDCSTSAAPYVFARRYGAPLHTGFCFRTGLARWYIEMGPAIPLHENGRERSAEEVVTDMNRVFEEAIRRDPANWFWVHNRWKSAGRPPRPKPASESSASGDANES